jgi:hypothetical protein
MTIRGNCLCGEVSYEVTGPYPTAWQDKQKVYI